MKLRYVIVAALMALTACATPPPQPAPAPPAPPSRLFQVELKTNVPVDGLDKQPNSSYLCEQGMETLSAIPSLIKYEVAESHFEGHVVKTVRFGEGNANWIEYDTVIAERVRALIVNNRFGAKVPTYKASDGKEVRHPVSFPPIDEELRKLDLCLVKPPLK